jgi:hypothetical protein
LPRRRVASAWWCGDHGSEVSVSLAKQGKQVTRRGARLAYCRRVYFAQFGRAQSLRRLMDEAGWCRWSTPRSRITPMAWGSTRKARNRSCRRHGRQCLEARSEDRLARALRAKCTTCIPLAMPRCPFHPQSDRGWPLGRAHRVAAGARRLEYGGRATGWGKTTVHLAGRHPERGQEHPDRRRDRTKVRVPCYSVLIRPTMGHSGGHRLNPRA